MAQLSSFLKLLQEYPTTTVAFATLGSLWTAYQLRKILSFIYLHFVHRSTLKRYLSSENGSAGPAWALVTGASDGIGKGFAEELCERGFNVILHGRNKQKLERLKEDLIKQWPRRQVDILIIDAQKDASNAAKLDAAVSQLKNRGLRLLVNNVGGTGGVLPGWAPMEIRRASDVTTFLDLNAQFPAQITRAFLPQLLRQQPSLVINIGSAASKFPVPYVSTYSGSKAFVETESFCLTSELKAAKQDVEVICVLVGLVSTHMEPRPVSFFVPSSREMAKSSLDKIGCGRSKVYAYWPHALQFGLYDMLPASMMEDAVVKIATEEMAKERARTKMQ